MIPLTTEELDELEKRAKNGLEFDCMGGAHVYAGCNIRDHKMTLSEAKTVLNATSADVWLSDGSSSTVFGWLKR